MADAAYEDFLLPNEVLCYGGGKLAEAQIPNMVRSGIEPELQEICFSVNDKRQIGKYCLAFQRMMDDGSEV